MFILVTGGAGFIGSHIVDYLLSKNHRVRVLDNLSTGNKENLKSAYNHLNFEFMHGDITNLEVCRNACQDIDLVCHQAALGSVPRSIENPLISHQANVDGFLNILIAMKENNIKKIVYASSSSVYGDHPDLPKKEENIGHLLSPYALTKFINEQYAEIFSRTYNFECIGLRYFNVFGPRQDPNSIYSAVIPKFIKSITNGQSVQINGDGSYSRDFTYIENVVQANYLALFSNFLLVGPLQAGQAGQSGQSGQSGHYGIFNIASGGRVTILELYEELLDCIKVYNPDVNSNHAFCPVRPGDIPHSNADISKAMNYLSYYPHVSFKEGIMKLVQYVMNS